MPEPRPSVEVKSDVVVALVSKVEPKSVDEASCAPPVALNMPEMVEEPVMASAEVVPEPKENAPPVIKPVLEIENSEFTAPVLVVEEIWKSVVLSEVEAD